MHEAVALLNRILWQNRRFTKVASSISDIKKDTEEKIDSISNFAIDTRSHIQTMNQTFKVMRRSRYILTFLLSYDRFQEIMSVSMHITL